MFSLSSDPGGGGVDAVATVATLRRGLPQSFSAPPPPPQQQERPLSQAEGGDGCAGGGGGLLRVTVSDPQRLPAAAAPASALALALAPPHLSYRVAGESTLPGYGGGGVVDGRPPSASSPAPFSVRRRFSDFEALRVLLAQHNRGFFIPPLPEKAFLDAKLAALTAPSPEGDGGGDDNNANGGGKAAAGAPPSSFVAVRTADLAFFVRAVASHPALRNSAALRVFLTHDTEGAWKEAAAAAAAAAGGQGGSAGKLAQPLTLPPPLPSPSAAVFLRSPGGVLALRCKHSLFSAFDGAAATFAMAAAAAGAISSGSATTTTTTTAAAAAAGATTTTTTTALAIPEAERALRAARESTADLARQLHHAAAGARGLVTRMAALAGDFGALGAGLASFSRWEDARARRVGQYTPEGAAASARAAGLQTSALGALRAEAVYRRGAGGSAAALVGFHDLLALAPGAVAALEERERAHSALCVLEAEARDRLAALQRARDAEAAAATTATTTTTTSGQQQQHQQHQQQHQRPAAAAPSPAASREARRAAAAREAYDAAEAQAQAQRRSYAELARHNASELERLSALRSSEQRAALVGFARAQRAAAAALGELFEGIEAQLMHQVGGEGAGVA